MQKKKAKKLKKLKNTIMASFKAKIVWKGQEREKLKFIVSFSSYLTRYRIFQKNSKEIQKIKKYHYGIISSQNRLKENEKERK